MQNLVQRNHCQGVLGALLFLVVLKAREVAECAPLAMAHGYLANAVHTRCIILWNSSLKWGKRNSIGVAFIAHVYNQVMHSPSALPTDAARRYCSAHMRRIRVPQKTGIIY